ncbi:hypothetical protein J6590_099711, partial [Homalodisca vitripennis]
IRVVLAKPIKPRTEGELFLDCGADIHSNKGKDRTASSLFGREDLSLWVAEGGCDGLWGTNMAKGTSNHSNGPHMWVIQLHLSRTFTADTLTWNCVCVFSYICPAPTSVPHVYCGHFDPALCLSVQLHLFRTFTADTLTWKCVCMFSYICPAPTSVPHLYCGHFDLEMCLYVQPHLSRTFTADTLTPHYVSVFRYTCPARLLRTL